MTSPEFDITTVIPTKYKPWVGAIGSLLTFIVPTVTTYATGLPQPWPVVIAGVIAGLTWLGIYNAPYKPTGTVLVPESVVPPTPEPPAGGEYKNPWKS